MNDDVAFVSFPGVMSEAGWSGIDSFILLRHRVLWQLTTFASLLAILALEVTLQLPTHTLTITTPQTTRTIQQLSMATPMSI